MRAGPLSVSTVDSLYAFIFLEAYPSTHTVVQLQAANRILHYRPPLSTTAFYFFNFLFIFLNKSNWFPTAWIISLLTCILL